MNRPVGRYGDPWATLRVGVVFTVVIFTLAFWLMKQFDGRELKVGDCATAQYIWTRCDGRAAQFRVDRLVREGECPDGDTGYFQPNHTDLVCLVPIHPPPLILPLPAPTP